MYVTKKDIKARNRFARYHEIGKLFERYGVDSNPALTQYLHLIQSMSVAKDAYAKYVRDMGKWLDNLEQHALEDLNKVMYKQEVRNEAKVG